MSMPVLQVGGLALAARGDGERQLAGPVPLDRPLRAEHPVMEPFGDLFDHLSAKHRQIVGIAAGNDPVVGNHRGIDPFSPRILKIAS